MNFILLNIQGNLRGKVDIFGGDSIGHCEKKNRINMCLFVNVYRHRGVWLYRYKSNVNVSREREITYTVHFILILI
jgi:hypothetical protein